MVFSLVIHSDMFVSCKHLFISIATLSWMEVNFIITIIHFILFVYQFIHFFKNIFSYIEIIGIRVDTESKQKFSEFSLLCVRVTSDRVTAIVYVFVHSCFSRVHKLSSEDFQRTRHISVGRY